jgi:GSCFA family
MARKPKNPETTKAVPKPNPYQSLPETAFWKTAVAAKAPFEIRGLWEPKFRVLPFHKIATAGSCFAQHIGNALAARGYHWFDAEPAPTGLSDASRKEFNYGVFSFRTGNIYTAAALRQWLEWAFEIKQPPAEVWEQDGRFYDPFRPAIEPNGFASADEMQNARKTTLAAVKRAVLETDFFVFTMGLTESWINIEEGYEYAMCPGTLVGEFDPQQHRFLNHDFDKVRSDLKAALRILRRENPKLRIILTVSPVPLTASASGQHVLTATTQSKSILRAVAADRVEKSRFVDYFPSYEIITGAPFRSMFYAPNLRQVQAQGVALVMDNFFADQLAKFGPPKSRRVKVAKPAGKQEDADVTCEEEMLNAFAK